MYPYNSKIGLGQVALYVNNLDLITDYYIKILGFDLKSKDTKEALLGFEGSDEEVLRLIKTDNKIEKRSTYDLFHIAILLKEKSELANSLQHLRKNNIKTTAAADHGYSLAIYVRDPEDNGVEIVWDKDVSEWDIKEDGKILGRGDDLDTEALLKEATDEVGFKFSSETRLGHVHLQAREPLKTAAVYQEVFPLTEKAARDTASWIASGEYHHQLAFNGWAGDSLDNREDGISGLAYFTIKFKDADEYQTSLNKAKEKFNFIEETPDNHIFEDLNGLRVRVELEK